MSSARPQPVLASQRSVGTRAPRGRGGLRSHGPLANSEGFVLVAALVLITAMSALAAFGSRTAQMELQTAGNHLRAHQALASAEAGIAHAFAVLRTGSGSFDAELASGGTGGTLADLGSVQLIGGVACRFRPVGSGRSDGYYVRAEDNHDETTGANDPAKDLDGIIKLVSRGTAGNGERIVEVLIKNVNNWGNGFFGRDGIVMSGGSVADSYSGTYDPFHHGASSKLSSNGTVTLSGGGTVVYGDASAGATVKVSGGATVTGTTTNNAAAVAPPPVSACGPPYSMSTGIAGVLGCSPISTCYDSSTGVLNVGGGNKVSLAAGTYCFSSVTLSGGSTLVVSEPVNISLTAASVLSGGSVVNTTNDPTHLQITSSFDSGGSTSTGIKLSGGSGAYFTFNGPNCAVIWSGGSDFYGAIIASYINDSGGTSMHFYEGLNTRATASIVGWHEVRDE
jgi:hypothetical protein